MGGLLHNNEMTWSQKACSNYIHSLEIGNESKKQGKVQKKTKIFREINSNCDLKVEYCFHGIEMVRANFRSG